ncbi:MAG TPA: hypothetical protein VIO33_16165 [Burkholderiaceae bacterium]
MKSKHDPAANADIQQPACKAHMLERHAEAGKTTTGSSQSDERRADPWDQWKSARDLH